MIVYIWLYIYDCIYIYICDCIYIHMWLYIYICDCIYIHMWLYIYTYVIVYIYTYVIVYIYICDCIYIYTYVIVYMHDAWCLYITSCFRLIFPNMSKFRTANQVYTKSWLCLSVCIFTIPRAFWQDKSPAAVKDVILSSAVPGSEDAKKRVLLQLVVEPRCCQRLMS